MTELRTGYRWTVVRKTAGRRKPATQYVDKQTAEAHAREIGGWVEQLPFRPMKRYEDSWGRLKVKGLHQSNASMTLARKEAAESELNR